MKIAIVNHDDLSIWLFRRGLIRRLVQDGHEVYILCGDGPLVSKIVALGAIHQRFDLPRLVTPRADLVGVVALFRLLRRNRYDMVHLFQHKIIVYGAIVAKLAGIRRIYASSTGIGFIMNDFPALKHRLLQFVLKFLYRVSLPLIDRVLFQNIEDRDHFCGLGLIERERTVIVEGSGVDLDAYSCGAVDPTALEDLEAALGDTGDRLIVLMVARAVLTKGVREFIAAAEQVESTMPNRALFVLVGGVEPTNPEAIDAAELRASEGAYFHWLGWRDAIVEALHMSAVVVLPSYREGTPRSLLEAMAMAKPIVTTDAPGCRNVVEDGRNGFMVPVRDSENLARAIATLLDDEDLRRQFGKRSYRKVVEQFEERSVAERIIRELYGFGAAVNDGDGSKRSAAG